MSLFHVGSIINQGAKRLEQASCVVVLSVTILLLFAIINRAFSLGFSGIPGLSRLMGIWITFLILPQLTLDNRHIKVEYFYDQASDRVQYLLDMLTMILGVIFCLFIFISASITVYDFHGTMIAELGISAAWRYSAVLVGFLGAFSVYTHQAYNTISIKDVIS